MEISTDTTPTTFTVVPRAATRTALSLTDILDHLSLFLPLKDLATCSLVCQSWYTIFSAVLSQFWTISWTKISLSCGRVLTPAYERRSEQYVLYEDRTNLSVIQASRMYSSDFYSRFLGLRQALTLQNNAPIIPSIKEMKEKIRWEETIHGGENGNQGRGKGKRGSDGWMVRHLRMDGRIGWKQLKLLEKFNLEQEDGPSTTTTTTAMTKTIKDRKSKRRQKMYSILKTVQLQDFSVFSPSINQFDNFSYCIWLCKSFFPSLTQLEGLHFQGMNPTHIPFYGLVPVSEQVIEKISHLSKLKWCRIENSKIRLESVLQILKSWKHLEKLVLVGGLALVGKEVNRGKILKEQEALFEKVVTSDDEDENSGNEKVVAITNGDDEDEDGDADGYLVGGESRNKDGRQGERLKSLNLVTLPPISTCLKTRLMKEEFWMAEKIHTLVFEHFTHSMPFASILEILSHCRNSVSVLTIRGLSIASGYRSEENIRKEQVRYGLKLPKLEILTIDLGLKIGIQQLKFLLELSCGTSETGIKRLYLPRCLTFDSKMLDILVKSSKQRQALQVLDIRGTGLKSLDLVTILNRFPNLRVLEASDIPFSVTDIITPVVSVVTELSSSSLSSSTLPSLSLVPLSSSLINNVPRWACAASLERLSIQVTDLGRARMISSLGDTLIKVNQVPVKPTPLSDEKVAAAAAAAAKLPLFTGGVPMCGSLSHPSVTLSRLPIRDMGTKKNPVPSRAYREATRIAILHDVLGIIKKRKEAAEHGGDHTKENDIVDSVHAILASSSAIEDSGKEAKKPEKETAGKQQVLTLRLLESRSAVPMSLRKIRVNGFGHVRLTSGIAKLVTTDPEKQFDFEKTGFGKKILRMERKNDEGERKKATRVLAAVTDGSSSPTTVEAKQDSKASTTASDQEQAGECKSEQDPERGNDVDVNTLVEQVGNLKVSSVLVNKVDKEQEMEKKPKIVAPPVFGNKTDGVAVYPFRPQLGFNLDYHLGGVNKIFSRRTQRSCQLPSSPLPSTMDIVKETKKENGQEDNHIKADNGNTEKDDENKADKLNKNEMSLDKNVEENHMAPSPPSPVQELAKGIDSSDTTTTATTTITTTTVNSTLSSPSPATFTPIDDNQSPILTLRPPYMSLTEEIDWQNKLAAIYDSQAVCKVLGQCENLMYLKFGRALPKRIQVEPYDIMDLMGRMFHRGKGVEELMSIMKEKEAKIMRLKEKEGRAAKLEGKKDGDEDHDDQEEEEEDAEVENNNPVKKPIGDYHIWLGLSGGALQILTKKIKGLQVLEVDEKMIHGIGKEEVCWMKNIRVETAPK